MKTKMLIFVFLLGITDLFAQTLYVPGTIVKGKNASYYCAFENKLVVRVYNVNNVDTTTTMYYDDGTVVPYYVGLGGTIATETEDLVRVFQETLTQEERNTPGKTDRETKGIYKNSPGIADSAFRCQIGRAHV